MSLLFKRQTIAEAVMGELPADDLARLRVHMKACADCRAHYDALSLVADAAAVKKRREGDRERARLLQTLGLAATTDGARNEVTKKTTRVPRTWLIPLGLAPVAAVVAFVVIARSPATSPTDHAGSDVTWRGSEKAAGRDEALSAERASLSLRFYARRKDGGAAPGPVRLVGELPASGELRASRADQLQITYLGLKEPRYLLLVGVDGAGALHRYFPAGNAPVAPLQPSRDSRLLGPAVDLGASHPAGPVKIYAVVSRQPPDAAAAEAAVRRMKDAPADGATFALGGVLWIDP